jgi:transcriptional regulator PpsR
MFEDDVGSFIEDPDSTVSQVIEAVSDIALVVAEDGVIRDVHLGPVFRDEEAGSWRGRSWETTVTPATRGKVQELLEEARESGTSRTRQVNHQMPSGSEVAVGYTTVRIGRGRVLAVGRSLAAVSELQRQLVDAQQRMERDYWRLRQVETRYRLLFRLSSEAVLMLDADTLRVVDANPAAAEALGLDATTLVGSPFPTDLVGDSLDDLEEFLRQIRDRGTAPGITLSLRDGEEWYLKGSLVRQEGEEAFLLHMFPARAAGASAEIGAGEQGPILEVVEAIPDGFVVTDDEGRVLHANAAFVQMTEESSRGALVGRSLSEWLARPGADLTVLLGNLRRYGSIRLFPTQITGALGSDADVELSAVYLEEEGEAWCGVLVRHVGRRIAQPVRGVQDLTRAVEDMTRLLGSVALRKLVRDTVAMVEHHFIEAALELTGDNRTAAAELLGLSRQSLYTKLKRYDIDSSHKTSD